MKALSVHGGGAAFERTSCSVGRRGQYGPEGIDTLCGLDGRKSPDDMKPSSSASQSERTDEQRGDVSLDDDDVFRYNDGGFRYFDLRIALRGYLMGTSRVSQALQKRTLPNTVEYIVDRGTVELGAIVLNASVEGLAKYIENSSKSCLGVCSR